MILYLFYIYFYSPNKTEYVEPDLNSERLFVMLKIGTVSPVLVMSSGVKWSEVGG